MDKKISIIIPVYNIEKYIERCLNTVTSQTYHNLEIIVVDDGSTDNTSFLIDQYAKKDHRIKVIHQVNQGVSVARNKGLDIATGEYIGFVDGDDIIEEDMFEMLIKTLIEHNVQIAHCGYQMVFPNHTDYYYNTLQECYWNKEKGLFELLSGRMLEPGLWNKLYKAELFRNIRLPIGIQINEDLLCNFYLFMEAESSYYIDIPKYHYIIREGSATKSVMSEKKRRDKEYVAYKIYEECKKNSNLQYIAQERYVRILLENCMQQDWKSLSIESNEKLKEEFRTIFFDKRIGVKIKGMIFGVLYLPRCYRFIRKRYEKITGINHKYDL